MTKRSITLVRAGNTAEPFQLPQKDAELYATITEHYRNRRYSARHAEKTIKRDLAVINDMLTYARKAPWYWTEEDFEAWCADLGRNRKLATSSQRHYQSTIRSFLEYMVRNVRFSAEISRLFGIRVRQICTDDNCIPHLVERELDRERPAVSHQDVDDFFAAIDAEIQMCARFGCKGLRPLQRDKAMFGLMYYPARTCIPYFRAQTYVSLSHPLATGSKCNVQKAVGLNAVIY